MECEICSRPSIEGLNFVCTTCARSTVYLGRLENAIILLEKEKLGSQVNAITGPENSQVDSATTPEIRHVRTVWCSEVENAQVTETTARLEEIKSSANQTRKEIDSLRQEILERKSDLHSRREAMKTIHEAVPSRQKRLLHNLTDAGVKGLTTLNQLDYKSAASRAHLCRETAQLMRLRRRRKHIDESVGERYSVAGLSLPDFREINNARCTDLTAVLSSTAHLVVLLAFYLGVRLPAEITVPYKEYPLPTINTPSTSYLGKKVDFPGSGSIPSISSSLSASRHDNRGSHRPRPLFVGSDDKDEKLATVAKKDPMAFNFFVEGLALLAWDVAWLCRSQGFTSGTESWEEVCNVGKNLFHLILVAPQPAEDTRSTADRDIQRRKKISRQPVPSTQDATQNVTGKLGQASHLSATSFLGDVSHSDFLRGWKYDKHTPIADALRKTLLTEMNNAEWELLEEQEWDDGGEQFDEAVFIKTRALDGQEYDDARSIMTTKTHNEEPSTANRVPGTSGWTKLKSR